MTLTYMSGPICKRGHTPAIRYTIGGSCVVCAKAHALAWQRAHPEREHAKAAKRRAAIRRQVARPFVDLTRGYAALALFDRLAAGT